MLKLSRRDFGQNGDPIKPRKDDGGQEARSGSTEKEEIDGGRWRKQEMAASDRLVVSLSVRHTIRDGQSHRMSCHKQS